MKQCPEQLSMFSAEASHDLVNHSPWLEGKREKGMIVTYGRKCSGLSENLNRVGYLVRTYLESCELPGEQFVRIWSVRDTLSPFLILKLRLSEQSTDETDASLWPTPQAFDAKATEKWNPGSEWDRNKIAHTLPKAVSMWPTPTTRDYKDGSAESCKNVPVNGLLGRAIHMWPTPRVQCATGSGPSRTGHKADLQTVTGGQLNPTWVEWLMGFPLNYTEVD